MSSLTLLVRVSRRSRYYQYKGVWRGADGGESHREAYPNRSCFDLEIGLDAHLFKLAFSAFLQTLSGTPLPSSKYIPILFPIL